MKPTASRPRRGRAPAALLRGAVLLATVGAGVVLVGVGTASAESSPNIDRGTPVSLGVAILLFGVVPIALFVIIGGAAALPALRERHRYRPGRGWEHPSLWFAGPPDPDAAIARVPARPGAGAPPAVRGSADAVTGDRGGASASW